LLVNHLWLLRYLLMSDDVTVVYVQHFRGV